jgi:peptidyl-prolyl cis-trans isomerase A (cyclophilin A)
MRNSASTVLLILLGLLLAGCGEEEKAVAPPPKPPEPPAVYQVKFKTTKGDFIVEVNREWAERGADHFFALVYEKFYNGVRFHRIMRRYIVQWGISNDPKVQAIYGQMQIRDDAVKESNKRGTVTFAKLGANSRTTQVFINLRDNPDLDKEGFAPFGKVIEGLDVVENLWSSYGEVAPRGAGPDPMKIMMEGGAYLDREFPRLDSIIEATIVGLDELMKAGGDATPASAE